MLKAIRPHLQYHPGWKINFEGPNGPLIRWVGGIPIPTGNIRAMVKFIKAIAEVLETKKRLHFFQEGNMQPLPCLEYRSHTGQPRPQQMH